jgi:hypothetical protein
LVVTLNLAGPQAHGDASPNLAQTKSKSMRVPDDWDDDDEEEETDSQKIWETAYADPSSPRRGLIEMCG